jgi:CRP/FNR family transcriptional regulator, nitrogen oxide reductase regulator
MIGVIMLTIAAYDDVLRNCKLFRDLSKSGQKTVSEAGWQRQVAPEDYFYQQGDPATAFYVLLGGRAKLTKVTMDGHQVLARFLEPGDCFGVVAAQEGAEYPLSVQAVDACSAVTWDSVTLQDLLQRYPRIAINALQVMTVQCQEWQRRYEAMVTECVEQRVAGALVRLARQTGKRVRSGILIDIDLSRQDLAEMTGTTLYTVSRILSRWEQEELVELGRERVVIRDGHGLVEIAESL